MYNDSVERYFLFLTLKCAMYWQNAVKFSDIYETFFFH
jgi:hypothetical protein